MKKTFRKIGSVLQAVLLCLLAVLLIMVIVSSITGRKSGSLPRVFGLSFVVVQSGSMEPDIPVGSLIFIKSQAVYTVGDIVTYRDDSNAVGFTTHEIMSVSQDGTIITRGKTNNVDDPAFPADRIQGKFIGQFKGVGYAVEWVKTPVGMVVVIGAGLFVFFLPDLIARLKKNQNRSIEEDGNG